jgi:hypothetical protein
VPCFFCSSRGGTPGNHWGGAAWTNAGATLRGGEDAKKNDGKKAKKMTKKYRKPEQLAIQ